MSASALLAFDTTPPEVMVGSPTRSNTEVRAPITLSEPANVVVESDYDAEVVGNEIVISGVTSSVYEVEVEIIAVDDVGNESLTVAVIPVTKEDYQLPLTLTLDPGVRTLVIDPGIRNLVVDPAVRALNLQATPKALTIEPTSIRYLSLQSTEVRKLELSATPYRALALEESVRSLMIDPK